MLIKCLALEWGPAGVRVNGISPGPIEGSWGMKNVASPTAELVEKITKALPLRRWGTEDDIADAALYLSSDAGRYVTGAILEVDGGATIASPESGHADAVSAPQADPRVKGR
jgi:NAD(P)-dependent dehydrogenase (short-subunit alcohol dehydrogenase family)